MPVLKIKCLFVLLLFLFSCERNKTPDFILCEGKSFVIGSGRPPKGLPLKIYVYETIQIQQKEVWTLKDSFFTNSTGYYKHIIKSKGKNTSIMIRPALLPAYDCLDELNVTENGSYYQDFRFLTNSTLRIRFLNAHFSEGDSLVVSDPHSSFSVYAPWPVDVVYNFMYTAYEPIHFSFSLRRKGHWSEWEKVYFLYEDSTHFHEVVY